MQNLFQQSSLTFGNAKQYVAEQAGKQQTTEMLNRAGRSIQSAIQDWNKFNWKWTLTSATISADASGNFQLPYDIKDVYAVTTTGDYPQWVPSVSRRQLTRANARNLQVAPCSYDLYNKNNSGTLRIVGGTATALTLEYYRRMTVPCAVTASALAALNNTHEVHSSAGYGSALAGVNIGSPVIFTSGYAADNEVMFVTAVRQETADALYAEPQYGITLGLSGSACVGFSTAIAATIGGDNILLDVPETYEWGILSRAVVHFMAGVGGPADKMAEWKQQSATALEEALRDDRDAEDTDICFMPMPPVYPYNPNRIY